MRLKKSLGILFLFVLVANIVLFIMGILDSFVFWGVILVVAIFAYKVLPSIKK
ncbi:hypothetical protein K8R33_00305 [archaeon]|nr:hypothetical protein [archaeon]